VPPPSRSWMLAPRFEHEATPLHLDERVAFAEATVEPSYSAPTTSTASRSANHDLKDIGAASFGHRKKLLEIGCTYGEARVAPLLPAI
jgi:hypothetical protein